MSGIDARLKHRLALWLRSERAFGLKAVRVLPGGASNLIDPQADRQAAPAVIEAGRYIRDASSAVAGGEEMARRARGAAENADVPASAPQNAQPSLLPTGPTEGFAGDAPDRDEKIRRLTVMDASEVKGCQKCRLCETRTHTVFGEGDPDAKIFFIGEGPGENEDLQGRPFVGRAGQLLDKMIAGMGLRREQVFIANIVKCRPPGNRVPAMDEVQRCTPYLERQLEIIRPRVIVTLGRPSANYMLGNKSAMGQLRGQWHSWRGIRLMPTFHPSYVLRSYTEAVRATVWGDLKLVMTELGMTVLRRV